MAQVVGFQPMARLVAAKCPNCGANLRLDPDRDFVTCSYCQTSAFIRTATRPVTQQIAQQYPMVIDLPPPPKLGWALAVLGLFVLVAGAGAAVVAQSEGRHAARLSEPKVEPLDRDVPAPVLPPPQELQPVAEPGREMWGVTRSDPTPAKTPSVESTPGKVTAPSKNARVRAGAITVSGRLSPAEIQGVVRQHFGRFRMCYEQGLARTPGLQGRVGVRFVVGRDGAVSNVSNAGSDLGDSRVASCVISAFLGLTFPKPEGGIVTVLYPLLFSQS
jgi:hypothetical protein